MFHYLKEYLNIKLRDLKKIHMKETITDLAGNGLGGIYYELEERVLIKSPTGEEVECVLLIDADGISTNTYLVPVFNYLPVSIEEINKREAWED